MLTELGDHEIVALKGLTVHLLVPAKALVDAIRVAFPAVCPP
jgi:hypothetical protein